MSTKRTFRLAPGPKGFGPLGSFLAHHREPLEFLVRAWQQYGDIVHFRLGPQPVYLLSHSDHVKHVMTDRAANYPKPPSPPGGLVGNGLFRSEGDFWKKQRALIQPAFNRDKIGGLAVPVVDGTRELLDQWEARVRSGEPFDVYEEMSRLMFTLMFRLVFTVPPPESLYAATRRFVSLIGQREPAWVQILRPVMPFLSKRKALVDAEIKVLDAWLYPEIARRRREGSDRGDLLDMLLGLRDRDSGEGLSDVQVRDEAANIFGAGYEATAAALAWTWYLLHRNPEVDRRLREEVATVLGGRLPTAGDVPRLSYATLVFQESMRLLPPAWSLERMSVEADQLGGYDLPPRTYVIMLPYILHRHPGMWERPEVFDPERFLPERSVGRARFAYVPFGAGQRLCIGNHLALMQGTLILSMMVQRYRISPVRDTLPGLHAAITLTPQGGLPVVLSRAEPPAGQPPVSAAG